MNTETPMTRTETLRALRARQAQSRRNAKALVAAARAGNVAVVKALAEREQQQAAGFWAAVKQQG